MTTISQLRRRIAVLKRKQSPWAQPPGRRILPPCTFAEYKKEPWPCPWKFARHLRRQGYILHRLAHLVQYLRGCAERAAIPGQLRRGKLFPGISRPRLVALLKQQARGDPSFPRRREPRPEKLSEGAAATPLILSLSKDFPAGARPARGEPRPSRSS